MTLQEFTRYAESWGADVARWPADQRAEAMRIAASPQGAAVLAQARELDALLRAAAPQPAPARVDQVMRRVVTALANEQKPRPRLAGVLSRWLIPAAGLACAIGIGALVATVDTLAESGPDDAPGVLTMIFDMSSLGQGLAL